MKCFKGFNAVFDKDLKQMVPYFQKVRSSDIVPNNEIDIEQVTKLTSMRWVNDRTDNHVDRTSYRMIGEWDSKYDLNGETVGSDFCRGELIYDLYKDGRMKISGNLRLSGAEKTHVQHLSADMITFRVYLPIAFNEDSPKLRVQWAYGSHPMCNIMYAVRKAAITNYQLNPMADATEYGYLLEIFLIDYNEGESVSEYGTLYHNLCRKVDTEFHNTGETYADYVSNYFPFTISYDGWWKREQSVGLELPQKYDDEVLGTYKTSGYVPMLNKPDLVTGNVIRRLDPLITVKCNGYFTINPITEMRFFLCELPGTLDSGYIPENMLTFYA